MTPPIIEYVGQLINYHRRKKDPAAWFSVGFSLYVAADALWKRLRSALNAWQAGATLTAEQELALRLRGPFAMLAGMAIEDMLKGAIVQAGEAPPRGHDLVWLSEKVRIQWNGAQTDLLRRLTTFIRWAGRYPVALNESETNESRTLKSTDYRTLIDIASYLYDIHHGKREEAHAAE